MSALDVGINTALLVTLAGLVIRGRLTECASFTVYLVVVITCTNLKIFWPVTFYRWDFYVRQQLAYDACKLAIAAELAARAVAGYPGAQRMALRVGIVAALAAAVYLATGPGPGAEATLTLWQPRVLLVIAWTFAAVASLVVYYQLPVSFLHRGILLGFVTYVSAWTTVLAYLRRHDLVHGPMAFYESLDGTAYLLTAAAWAWVTNGGRDD